MQCVYATYPNLSSPASQGSFVSHRLQFLLAPGIYRAFLCSLQSISPPPEPQYTLTILLCQPNLTSSFDVPLENLFFLKAFSYCSPQATEGYHSPFHLYTNRIYILSKIFEWFYLHYRWRYSIIITLCSLNKRHLKFLKLLQLTLLYLYPSPLYFLFYATNSFKLMEEKNN